jgi:hypothetical protein
MERIALWDGARAWWLAEQIDDLAGGSERQRPQHRRVDDGEHRGVCAEHQRQRGRAGEEIRFPLQQGAPRLSEFRRECRHASTVAVDRQSAQCDFLIES